MITIFKKLLVIALLSTGYNQLNASQHQLPNTIPITIVMVPFSIPLYTPQGILYYPWVLPQVTYQYIPSLPAPVQALPTSPKIITMSSASRSTGKAVHTLDGLLEESPSPKRKSRSHSPAELAEIDAILEDLTPVKKKVKPKKIKPSNLWIDDFLLDNTQSQQPEMQST